MGGALLSLVTRSFNRPRDVTTTWGYLVPNIHTAQEFAWPFGFFDCPATATTTGVLHHATCSVQRPPKTTWFRGEYTRVSLFSSHIYLWYNTLTKLWLYFFYIPNWKYDKASKTIKLKQFSGNSLTISTWTYKSVEMVTEAGHLVNGIISACLHGWSHNCLATK